MKGRKEGKKEGRKKARKQRRRKEGRREGGKKKGEKEGRKEGRKKARRQERKEERKEGREARKQGRKIINLRSTLSSVFVGTTSFYHRARTACDCLWFSQEKPTILRAKSTSPCVFPRNKPFAVHFGLCFFCLV